MVIGHVNNIPMMQFHMLSSTEYARELQNNALSDALKHATLRENMLELNQLHSEGNTGWN